MRVRTMMAGVALLCGCTIPAGPPPPTPASVPAAPASEAAADAIARNLLAEVNRTREARGVRALRRDTVLDRAAGEHALELAERRTLDHVSTDPGRRTLTMRIEAAGGTWSRAAENLANMSGPASAVPARTARMWLDSEGHRRNMLDSAYTHTGTGIAIDRRGVWYVTQLYVLPSAGR